MAADNAAAKQDDVTPPAKAGAVDNDGLAPNAVRESGGAPPPSGPSSVAAQPKSKPLEMPEVKYPRASRFQPLSAGLMTTVGLLPALVSVPTIGLYLVLPNLGWTSNTGLVAVGGGLAIGLVAWFVLGLVFLWTSDPARVSPGIFAKLEARYVVIEARLAALQWESMTTGPKKSAYMQAVGMRNELCHMFDPSDNTIARKSGHWIGGAGYIAAWNRVHRAEEALMIIEDDSEVVGAALYDRDRLQGSAFPGRKDMLVTSALAISTLDFSMKPVVGLKVDATPAPTNADMARVVLADIKKAVNEYRDGLSDSLVYLRRRTIQGLLFVGLTGYLVIAVALIVGTSTTAVVAASAFYLAGAMIGLFHAAYLEQRRRVAVEDYGLYWTRLLLLPVIAGIAGLAGAGLTAFFVAPPLGLSLLEEPDLSKVFSLQEYPLGLAAAAIFGLTPGLLLDRIKALGDDVKIDIAKSNPSGKDKADDDDNSGGQSNSNVENELGGQEKSDAANNDND
jgi:hypothetical protein